jgi:hypothetical protein
MAPTSDALSGIHTRPLTDRSHPSVTMRLAPVARS